jgi:hypothetical protein
VFASVLKACWSANCLQCHEMRTNAIYIESEGGRKQEIICVLNSSRHQLLDLPCINDHIFSKHINPTCQPGRKIGLLEKT